MAAAIAAEASDMQGVPKTFKLLAGIIQYTGFEIGIHLNYQSEPMAIPPPQLDRLVWIFHILRRHLTR